MAPLIPMSKIASSFHSNLSLASHLKEMEMADVKNPDQFMNMFFGQHVISVFFPQKISGSNMFQINGFFG